MAVDLADVTLCAADSACVPLTDRALRASMQQCKFGDAILFTDQARACDYRVCPTGPLRSAAAYSEFMLKRLVFYVATSHVLVVQWDGYVVDGPLWSPEFLRYDYVGARWPHFDDGMHIGNGGFSLRSYRLLTALQDTRFEFLPEVNEDVLICRYYRPLLESEFGIRFAGDAVADRFCYENVPPIQPTFGFHGLRNMQRYLDDAQMMELIELLPQHVFRTGHCVALAFDYLQQDKIAHLSPLYRKIRKNVDRREIRHAFTALAGDRDSATAFLKAADKSLLRGTLRRWLWPAARNAAPPEATRRPAAEQSSNATVNLRASAGQMDEQA